MTTPSPRIGTSIVLVGNFNPAIIHPSWLARFEVLPPSDLEGEPTDPVLINPDFALFEVGWLRVQVTVDHFELSTLEQDRVPLLRDAGANILQLLSHSPVAALGINRTAHLPLAPGGWETLRDALAPHDPWSSVSAGTSLDSLTINVTRDSQAEDPGLVRVTVEPSRRIAGGLFISVNDHHELGSDEGPADTDPALRVLGKGWDDAIARHETYTRSVLKLAGEP